MADRILNNGQATDAAAPGAGTGAPEPDTEPAAEPERCAECMSGRAIILAAAFAAFAAYVAADFMSGGRLTAYLLGLFAARKGGDGG
jgi:hypothetical protein